MPIPKELIDSISPGTLDALSYIGSVAVFTVADEAKSALRSGAVLLSVARFDNDRDGDGFRCLVGWPRDVPVPEHLKELR